ncbi:MAG: hypothetical protein IJK29_00870 [Bacteroidales bacterium]|nr:hypothetical protein [Bacteroidales bacterium]
MPTDSYPTLLSAVQDILKRHGEWFDVIEPGRIRLDGFPLEMFPVLEITEKGVSFLCPVAYYETEEQCSAILDCCDKNRRIAYDDFGLGTSANLPESVSFLARKESQEVVARTFFDGDGILADPEEFLSSIDRIKGFSQALRNEKLFPVIYCRMPKTTIDSSAPRALFYCSLILARKGEEPLLPIDFNDVKTAFKHCKQLVFHPSLSADSIDGLLSKMEEACRGDLLPDERFGLIASISLPNHGRVDANPYTVLRERIDARPLCFGISMAADNDRPFSAEMVLLRV